MPTFDYECASCKHRLEVYQAMSAEKLVHCPACGDMTLERLIGRGSGVVFRGKDWTPRFHGKKG